MDLQYILYVARPLVQPAELMLGILLTLPHMLGAEASASWFVGRGGGEGLWYSCSQDA